LLKAEMAAGTYLPGLGPGAVWRGSARGGGPVISRQGTQDAKRSIAPRALICIDVHSGRRMKAVPVEGVLESVHSAGHYILMAMAPLEGFPGGIHGSLPVLDFTGEGFGLKSSQQQRRHAQGRVGMGKPLGGHGWKVPERRAGDQSASTPVPPTNGEGDIGGRSKRMRRSKAGPSSELGT